VQPNKIVRFEVPLEIQSTSMDGVQPKKIYTNSDPTKKSKMVSGVFVSTARTHQLFTMIAELLCVAERYIMEDLLQTSFGKLSSSLLEPTRFLFLFNTYLEASPKAEPISTNSSRTKCTSIFRD
jgi:hypothetical protein